jgi:hypothetical protein
MLGTEPVNTLEKVPFFVFSGRGLGGRLFGVLCSQPLLFAL